MNDEICLLDDWKLTRRPMKTNFIGSFRKYHTGVCHEGFLYALSQILQLQFNSGSLVLVYVAIMYISPTYPFRMN